MPSRHEDEELDGPIDVVIVDDADDVRLMVALGLEGDPRLRVVAQGASGREAVQLAMRLQPHVMVLDLVMPEVSGLDALPMIARASPRTRVVMYSSQPAKTTAPLAVAAGADTYVEKSAGMQQLANAIVEVHGR